MTRRNGQNGAENGRVSPRLLLAALSMVVAAAGLAAMARPTAAQVDEAVGHCSEADWNRDDHFCLGSATIEDQCVDDDGDGWGWRGVWPAGESCEVAAGGASSGGGLGGLGECVDPDGDGWGWRGVWPAGESCEVAAGGASSGGGLGGLGECVDDDGDGWGWRGVWPAGESCEVAPEARYGAGVPQTEISELEESSLRPKAVVSIGDSYLSGEAGRWAGNGDNVDRGIGIYGDTHQGGQGCHRSDVAPIRSAAIPDVEVFNLACSGAKSNDVTEGDQSQLVALRDIATSHKIEMIVISIGGNDAGVGELAAYCSKKSVTSGSCKQARFESFHRTVRDDVAGKVDELVADVQALKTGARIVLQSYISPYGNTMRYSGWERTSHGCPIQSKDRRWIRNELVQHFDDIYHRIALDRGIEFLSLADAFDGKELCAEGVTWGKYTTDPARLEWVRRVTLDADRTRESLHPNALGQQALGRCLRLLWATPEQSYHKCTNLGQGPNEMRLSHDAPTLVQPVQFAIDNVDIAEENGSLQYSTQVTASRTSTGSTVIFYFWRNGAWVDTDFRVVNLPAGEPAEISIEQFTGSYDGPQYQSGLSVEVREGVLFGARTEPITGPVVIPNVDLGP